MSWSGWRKRKRTGCATATETRNDRLMTTKGIANPNKVMVRPCIGCGCDIPAYGNRKRCLDCQDEAYKERQRASRARRTARDKQKKPGSD